MSEIAEIVDTLEDKVKKLFRKLESLEKDSDDLKLELQKAATIINRQSSEIKKIKNASFLRRFICFESGLELFTFLHFLFQFC